jgi:hypothetical protein
MTIRHAMIFTALVGLVGCGGSDNGFTLSSGTNTYDIAQQQAVAPDNCNLGGVLDGLAQSGLVLDVNGTSLTVKLFSDHPADDPSGMITGDTFSAGSTYTFDNNALPDGQNFDCVETITLSFDATLTADDTFDVTVQRSTTNVTGTACTADNLGYKTATCASTGTFTATKK